MPEVSFVQPYLIYHLSFLLTNNTFTRCQTKDHTKKKNLTIFNPLAIKARNRIIVIVTMIAGLIIVTVIDPTIVTATTPLVIAITRDMGTCTQQATEVDRTEEVVVTEEEEVMEGNMEEDIKKEEVKE